MKLRFSIRRLPNYSNFNRVILSNTLYIRHNNCLFISNTYLPGCKLRLTNPLPTCQRSINILYLLIPTCWTRALLRILYISRNMKYRSIIIIRSHSYGLYRVCSSMRTNVFLRRNSYHKPFISNPLYWLGPRPMNLRWVFSRQSNTHTIFCLPLHFTLHYCCLSRSSPIIPPRNWFQQPLWTIIRC